MQQLFRELLRLALGQSDCLSCSPTPEMWEELYAFAEKQALIGILYHGIEQLRDASQRPSRELRMKWFLASEKIKERNALLDRRCVELQARLTAAGFRSSLLKGQGLARYYGNLQALRNPGDIDVYVDSDREKAIAYAKSLGQQQVYWDYKHLHLHLWEKTSIELHYRVEMVLNPVKNSKLQRWFQQNQSQLFSEAGELVTPTLTMNLFYVLLHMYCHFFGSGIGQKQLIDYYFVLRAANGQFGTFEQGETLVDVLERFGMTRFAGGVMWLMQELTGMNSQYLYIEPLEKEGRFILDEMHLAGNLGQHDTRYKHYERHGKLGTLYAICKHNAHLLRHYPVDALMSPFWYIWHKLWMMSHQ